METILPPEILVEIFNYIENDHKVLLSSVLVNKHKQWHSFSKYSYFMEKHIFFYYRIIINCLLTIDKDLILDYSAPLRKFKTNDLKHEWKWNIEQRRFDFCFWHLYELAYGSSQSTFQLFDRLANTCKNIRILKIYICSSPHGDDVYYNLPKLMNLVLLKNFKEVILIHSNSSIDYYYNNGTHNLDSLLPNIRNLKSLTLYNTSRKINLKSILLL